MLGRNEFAIEQSMSMYGLRSNAMNVAQRRTCSRRREAGAGEAS